MTTDAMTSEAPAPLLRFHRVTKRYGPTQALAGVDLELRPAEIVGLIGHNGAGKSTLMRTIVGLTSPDGGSMEFAGTPVTAGHDLLSARRHGMRIAFQELSLAPALTVAENLLLVRPGLRGRGWRQRCGKLIGRQLEEVFPGHRIDVGDRVERLSLAQRQMVEIAQATLDDGDLRLLILDEPTSALGRQHAESLFAHMRRLQEHGVATILISHKMTEILGHTDRTVVMRDGRVVSEQPTADLDADSIVAAMGTPATDGSAARPGVRRERTAVPDDAPELLHTKGLTSGRLRDVDIVVREGEIVGLAGLDGQGQQDLLAELWRRRRSRSGAVRASVPMAFVTGDRQTAGVFPLWGVGLNIASGATETVSRYGVISRRRENALVADWMERLRVRGTARTPIIDLSGGNQQKALVARALASRARVVLLDDPFRGVDVGTRRELYRLMRDEVDRGRAFLWFTTENAELGECDRVYVMRHGAVVTELANDEIGEEAVVAASFAGT